MPKFVRTTWLGKPQFSIHHEDDPARKRERQGKVAASDIIEITDAEAAQGIDALCARYFADGTEAEGYHGA